MRYHQIDNSFFETNRTNFARLLPKNSVAIFHANDQFPRNGDQFYPYRQQSDFFYLTGIDQEKTILIIAPEASNPKLKEALFLLETNERMAIYDGHKYNKEEASKVSGIEHCYWLDDFDLSYHLPSPCIQGQRHPSRQSPHRW